MITGGHQEVKIALHSLSYHHTYRWLQEIIRRSKLHYTASGIITPIGGRTATYRCDDTRGCVMQFWPPDDEHMCSKHVEAWNKTYCETNFFCINLVKYWDKWLFLLLDTEDITPAKIRDAYDSLQTQYLLQAHEATRLITFLENKCSIIPHALFVLTVKRSGHMKSTFLSPHDGHN